MDIYSGITCDTEVASKILKLVIKAGTNAMLWGKPGVGKTSICYQLAQEHFDSCVVINPSQDDVIDLKLPYIDTLKLDEEHTVSRCAISERLPRSGKHLIFVDEINTASMAMQATLYSLILEGRIGSYRLPPGCVRLAAGNRLEDKCAANEMSLALKDRLGVHMNIVPSLNAWTKWATLNGIAPEVLAYVRNMPNCLEGLNEHDPSAGCTPRSLEALSKLVKEGIDPDIQSIVVNGTIGMGAGAEFVGFLDIFRNQIDIEDIIRNPDKVDVPTKLDVIFSIISALGAKIDEDNIDNIVVFLRRLKERRYMMMAIMDALNRKPSIVNNKTMNTLIKENFKYFV